MKTLFINLLRSIFRNPALFLKFRDTVLVNPAEHLYRTRKYIFDHGLESNAHTIIDIGAADGMTCKWFATAFPGHSVIGFEAVKASFEKAVATNTQLKNVDIRHLALGHESGQAEMQVTADPLASTMLQVNAGFSKEVAGDHPGKFKVGHTEIVAKKRLDEVISPKEEVLLVKIDVQGAELEVLRGATSTLKHTRLVLVEMSNHALYQGGTSYHEVDAFLRSQAFRLVDMYVTYRPKGVMAEYDALYQNSTA